MERRELGVQGGMGLVMLPISGEFLSLPVGQSTQRDEEDARMVVVFAAGFSPIPKLSPERASEKTQGLNNFRDQDL